MANSTVVTKNTGNLLTASELNNIVSSINSKADQTVVDLKALAARTITINGTTFDLSANRSWTIAGGGGGTVDVSIIYGSTNAVSGNAVFDALLLKADNSIFTSHSSNTSNPHNVTKTQIGLGNVDNTSDTNKPVSIAQAASIATKQNTLVSGTSIKTVNGNSLLGSGDISISAGGSISIDSTPISGSSNAVGSGGVFTALGGKQASLVSGTNIKTLNGTSLLGSGNIDLSGSISDGDKGDITVSTGGTLWVIDAGAVSNTKLGTGIDASKLADGSVSNAEYQALNGVTSSIQDQINALGEGLSVIQALTSSTNITWNHILGDVATLTLAHNATLSITNSNDTDSGYLVVTQDGTGGRTLSLPNATNVLIKTGAGEVTTLGWIKVAGVFKWTGDYIAGTNTTIIGNVISSTGGGGSSSPYPRMTTAQRDAIATPQAGATIYDTTANKVSVYNGTIWKYLAYE